MGEMNLVAMSLSSYLKLLFHNLNLYNIFVVVLAQYLVLINFVSANEYGYSL